LFCVAPGHQLGFNDLKAIEVAGLLDAGRRPEPFNFRAGLRIRTLVETIHASSRASAWQEIRQTFALARICSYFGALPPRRSCTASLFGDRRYAWVYRIPLQPRRQGHR
jgi:hypothetical protein